MANYTTRNKVLLVAGLLGLITGVLTYGFLRKAQAADQEMVSATIAAVDIQPRTVIEGWMLSLKNVPRSRIPGGVFLSKPFIVGKVALVKIPADCLIGADQVEARGASLGLSYVIPACMRALTVAVDPVIGVAGFLKPGDHVDVVATFNTSQNPMAKTVVQNVQLCALGSQLQGDHLQKDSGVASPMSSKDTATLLVTPQQAEALVLAENQGKLRLVLRGVKDFAWIHTKGVTAEAVTGVADPSRIDRVAPHPARRLEATAPARIYAVPSQQPAARLPKPTDSAPLPPAPRPVIEVIRGTNVENVVVGSITKETKLP